MKKRIFALALAAVMLLAFIPVRTQAQPFEAVTGEEMMQRLGIGINIANTLEAVPWLGFTGDYERVWQEVPVERWHLQAMAQMGFDHVRIPVTWELRMDAGGNISPQFMARVQQAVDWGLEAGLYVVLNTHHEWNFIEMAYSDILRGEDWLRHTWQQIATHFRDYSHRLIFEPLNEPFHEMERTAARGELVNRLNRAALDTIRATGGNNSRRVVINAIQGANANQLPHYTHTYDDPYTMLGVFLYSWDNIDDIRAIVDRGIPLYVKEIAPATGYGDPPAIGQIPWVTRYFGILAEMGVPTAYWTAAAETGSPYYDWPWLFDRSVNLWNTPILTALFAAHGRTPGTVLANAPILPHILHDGAMTINSFGLALPVRLAEKTDVMVVEYAGHFGLGVFNNYTSADGVQSFYPTHNLVTHEPGRMVFDICSLPAYSSFGFTVYHTYPQVTRIYLDTLAGLAVTQQASNWAQGYVLTARANNLIPTALQSNFTRATTRQEFAQLAVVLYESIRGEIQGRETFTDTSNTYVQKAAYIGVVSGMGDGTFNPQGQLTRAQAAAMMSRLATAMGAPLPQHTPTFGDTNDFPIWAADYIGQMQASGIMGGLPDGTFAPQDPYTREASITTIVRLLRRLI